MELRIAKDTLIENLNIVLKAVSNKVTMPILECVLLEAYNNTLKLTSTDLELGIETGKTDSFVNEEGSICLNARQFYEIVRSLPEDEVIIKSEKDICFIKSGKSEFKLYYLKSDEFPKLPKIERENKYQIEGSVLKNIIRQTIFSVSTDESKMVLTGEKIEITDNLLKIVAIDGFRVSYRELNINNNYEDIEVVVPSKALNEISKIISDKENVNLYFTDSHILFECEKCIVVSRLLEGNFLRYEQFFGNESTTKVKVNVKNLLSAIERASLISNQLKKTPVLLKIERSVMTINSNTQTGTFYEEIPVETEGNEMEITFNPRFICDALRVIEDEEVKLFFNTNLNPCIIRGIEDNSYKYLILPLRS